MNALSKITLHSTLIATCSLAPPQTVTSQGANETADTSAQEALRSSEHDRPTTRVSWHPSLTDAQHASEESGKPVLVFQLLGRLDEQLC